MREQLTRCVSIFVLTVCACSDDGELQGRRSSAVEGKDARGDDTASESDVCDPTTEVVKIDEDVAEDTTWECGTYLLQKLIFVRGDSTLTIEPGVHVLGDTDVSGVVAALIVTRGAKLDAVGTRDAPIVFSSGNPEGARAPGDWGGVVMLGHASVNTGRCRDSEDGDCSGGFFEDNVNGLDPTESGSVYGGRDDSWDCGHLEYARIEFAGYQLSVDNELNGLSVGACGTATRLHYIQVHHGADDAIEFFGGTAGIDHALVTGGADDGLDWDYGWRGDAQFVIVHQRGEGDHGLEGDGLAENERATPRAKPRLYNFTLFGNPTRSSILLRAGTLGELRNFIVQGAASAVDLATTQLDLAADWPANLSIEGSVFFDNASIGDPDDEDDDKGFNEDEAVRAVDRDNAFDVDPGLSDDFDDPVYKPTNAALGGKATPPAGFDTSATYAGAVDPDGEDWTLGWTTRADD